MTLEDIKGIVKQTAAFQSLLRRLAETKRGDQIDIADVPTSLWSIVLSLLLEISGKPLLVIASTLEEAEKMRDDFMHLQCENLCFFSGKMSNINDVFSQFPTDDIETLKLTREKGIFLIVTTKEALDIHLPSPEEFGQAIKVFRRTDTVVFEEFLNWLLERGFERKKFVESPGDIAIRGGIIDVFPFIGEHPLRIEFAGDTVESIREFDALSQRSIREIQSADIVAHISTKHTDEPSTATTILNYIPSGTIIGLSDETLLSADHLGISSPVREQLQQHVQIVRHLVSVEENLSFISFQTSSQPAFNGSVKELHRHLANLKMNNVEIFLLCEEMSFGERLKELLEEIPGNDGQHSDLDFHIVVPSLHHGFFLGADRIAIYTEHEIFGRRQASQLDRMPHRANLYGLSLRDVRTLHPGDYVVHVDYGIGKFVGLEKIRVHGVEQESVKLLYAENGVLYVNLNFLNRIQKYSSRDGVVPKLSVLGSADWERLKNRAKKRIKDLARDLIRLYARRKHEEGFAFSPDTPWQKELEASFIYEDTADQARATAEVKQDMESPKPADRLICGDAGFGKTEIAVRAAFKAVMDGKQVALLAPTTILAMQHYQTFLDRISKYSVVVDVLSRFRTKQEQEKILERLKQGQIDIIIGTHRLLSADVKFKDLGLLIIDEEQRFGVAAKEKLRTMKATVDTLTLTATPIPRTLQFALMGARDLSILSTPPRNRLPVITKVMPFDTAVIRQAILRELHRGGQVFIVGDRIDSLNDLAVILLKHVPQVTFAIAHGQMRAHELERVMIRFLERKVDVLVSTKIIESGIDMPNVNTIIVNRADRFGLSELYQLRGRVGRSNVQAYAYFLTPPFSTLTREALKRLQTLEEFTEFGAGFAIAMRDLEIRGAGNLLGAEQSGFIDGLGMDLYTKILDEAIRELKSEEFPELFPAEVAPIRKKTDVVIETDVEALIPEFYVDDMAERLDIYRRLYAAADEAAVDEISNELLDRFGRFPEEVDHLFEIVKLRLLAQRGGFVRINIAGQSLQLTMPTTSDREFYSGEVFQSILDAIHSGILYEAQLRQEKDHLALHINLSASSGKEKLMNAAKIISAILNGSHAVAHPVD
ncbi:MAG: transcription-repair coupling factor [Bacteroidota bacterium]